MLVFTIGLGAFLGVLLAGAMIGMKDTANNQ